MKKVLNMKKFIYFISILLLYSCIHRSQEGIVDTVKPANDDRYYVTVEFKNLSDLGVPEYSTNKFSVANNNYNILDTVVLDVEGDYIGRCVKISRSNDREIIKIKYENNNGEHLKWFIPISNGIFKVGDDVYLRNKSSNTLSNPPVNNSKSNKNKKHNFVE